VAQGATRARAGPGVAAGQELLRDAESVTWTRTFFAIAVLLVGAFFAYRLWIVTCLPPADLVTAVADDAFYYYGTARHIVAGHGATFDGINATNGFHPLWMLAILPIWGVVADPALAVRVALCLQLLLFLASIVVVMRMVWRRFGPGPLVASLWIPFFPHFSNRFTEGLETSLLLALVTAAVWFMATEWFRKPRARWRDVCMGGLLGLIFLARLDAAMLAAVCFVVLWIRCLRDEPAGARVATAFRRSLWVGVPIVVVALPYLCWNMARFGHLLSISGALKSSFPRPALRLEVFLPYKAFAALAALALAVLVGGLMWRRRLQDAGWSAEDRAYLRALNVFCLFVVGHFVFMLLFMKWEVAGWYFAPYVLVPVLAAGPVWRLLGLDERASRTRLVSFAVVGLVGLGAAADAGAHFISLSKRLRGTSHPFNRHTYQAAQWVKAHLPRDAVLAMTDCGIFGYFAERSVVNLDGVINNYEYQEFLRTRSFAEYLRSRKVQYLVHYAAAIPPDYETFDYWVTNRLYDRGGGFVRLHRREELRRFRYRRPERGGYDVSVILWRLRRAAGMREDLSTPLPPG